MLVLEVGHARPEGADIATKHCKHSTTQTMLSVTFFSGRVSESLSDNIQIGVLKDRMTLTRGSSSTLEEEEEATMSILKKQEADTPVKSI
jgi:hypothetical protein